MADRAKSFLLTEEIIFTHAKGEVNLTGAIMSKVQLNNIVFRNTTMPDGTIRIDPDP